MSESKRFYAIFRAFSFENSFTAQGYGIKLVEGEPSHFIPIFKTREEAVKWNDGKEDNIREMETVL